MNSRELRPPEKHKNQKTKSRDIDESQLSHTKYNCLYHIVFIPKYRRKAIYDKLCRDIGIILRRLCEYKEVEIIEAHACVDHIHMLLRIPPKISVSQFMGYLKGKSSIMIYNKWGNMKYKYRNRAFWCRGYYVDTVGKNTKAIAAYIQHQLEEDRMAGQMTLEEGNPFNG